MSRDLVIDVVDEKIEDLDINSEMKTSFLEYAYSVIYSRALPDARDGLKPVQRRIVYQMSQMNLYPDRPYVKSARVVGDVMGKLHPHGDSAIYDALVRMAQDFSLRMPLVDGHGNFGSPDDGPAAARYTEARMTPSSLYMCEGLDEDTVDFIPNYDNKLTQPEVLPSGIPNLLVNGTTGIAVGMATNMAPHNLSEVVKAAIFLIKNPDCTLDDLMKFIPGPDFPTGGKVIGLDNVREAYETGKSIIKMRAKTSIEKISAKKQGIIITEIPYMVGPEKIVEKIAENVKNQKIEGISNVVDLTDRKNGLKIVVEIKNGYNPNAILTRLYKLTPLEESFGINNVALVDGTPQTLGLKALLNVWVKHRLEVVRRQTEFRLKAKQDRLHLVEGLLLAILDIDEVINIIRTSDDSNDAGMKLQKIFDLDEIQSNYILDLRLRRLTKFSQIELENEKASLLEEIEKLQNILNSKETLENEVCSQMLEASKKYGDERRTQLLSDASSGINDISNSSNSSANGAITSDMFSSLMSGIEKSADKKTKPDTEGNFSDLEIPDVPCYIIQSATGLIARTVRTEKETAKFPPISQERSHHDALEYSILSTTRSNFGVLTTHGRILLAHCVDLPEIGRGENVKTDKLDTNTQGIPKIDKLEISGLSGGVSLNSFVKSQLSGTETALCIVPIYEKAGQLKTAKPLAIGTTLGVVKRVKPELAPHDRGGNTHLVWEAISLQPGDSVVGAAVAGDDDEIVFVSSDSSLLHYQSKLVRPQGLSGGGMAGIKLSTNQHVISFHVIDKEELQDQNNPPLVFTVAGDGGALPGTQNGFGKLTPFNLFPGKGRATGGVRSQKFLKGQNQLIYAWAGRGTARANTNTGLPVDFPEIDMRRDGSGSLLDSPISAIG